MVNVAVMGFGVVGSGVVEVIDDGAVSRRTGVSINVKRILDIKRFEGTPYFDRVTLNFEDIVGDPEVSIVVECIGGISPALEFTKRLFMAGKSVVTSNKELVATYGAELLELARANGVCYMFEASVGGGIPIIRPLVQCLVSDEITEIVGILNGTTNYILSKMLDKGMSFGEALVRAQEKGYAERDPSADVEGIDTQRKIAILSALCYGYQIDCNSIPTQGITEITIDDIKAAREAGRVIKLVGRSRREEDGRISAEVRPIALEEGHPLAGVKGVYNAIMVTGNVTGDVMFYGRGAGKLPTASAVVADIVDIVKNGSKNAPFWME